MQKNIFEKISMEGEIWKKSRIANGYYVSNYGRVYGVYNKLIKPEISNGYERVFIKNPDENRFQHYFVHVLVATEFCEGKSEGSEVHHRNKNKLDNSACNLMWVSKTAHKYIHSLLDSIEKLGGAAV